MDIHTFAEDVERVLKEVVLLIDATIVLMYIARSFIKKKVREEVEQERQEDER